MSGERQSDDGPVGAGLIALCLEISASIEDEVAAELYDHGCLGVQPADARLRPAEGAPPTLVEVEALFQPEEPAAIEALTRRVESSLRSFHGRGRIARLCGTRAVEDRDWLAEYRARATPIEIGPFVFDPRDPTDGGEPTLRRKQPFRFSLPAQRAFGTGSHETTRLMIELLCMQPPKGLSVLDVGSGSGILGMVCEALGARSVLGIEIDADSTFVARENFERNRCRRQLQVLGLVDCLRTHGERSAPEAIRVTSAPVPGFDRLLVNVLPHRLLGAEARVRSLLAAGGRLVVSGVLVDLESEVVQRWRREGLELETKRRCGDWLGFVFGPRPEDGP